MRLSKSQFTRGLQCDKSLWLYHHKRKLREVPDETQQAVFDTGTQVGILAQQLFPNGEEIVYSHDKIHHNIKETQQLINKGSKTIYEATFSYQNVLVMVDILHKGLRGWEMYEVKSSTEVKNVYYDDLAIQYFVVAGAGLTISKSSIVHINNQYLRDGELDINELFVNVNLTKEIKKRQPHVKKELGRLKRMLKKQEPEIDIGPHCSDPYGCDFSNYCWNHIPDISVFDLSRMRSAQKFELYYNDIIKFEDIPEDVKLTRGQRIQIEAEIDDKKFIDKDKIKSLLKEIKQPIGFLDFETFNPAVPEFNQQRPYQQIPFQYSLHKYFGGKLSHYEFLAEPGDDPRKDFIRNLLEDTKTCKAIIVYNKAFESGILKGLGEFWPYYRKKLLNISDRMFDLMIPFQKKDYYVKEMNGSASLKVVLPTLVPTLSYEGLGIADGGMAMNAYASLSLIDNETESENIKSNLLEYCKLDTLAMVEIWKKLQQL